MHKNMHQIKSGVPQDTVVRPLLFLIYINNMSERLTEGMKIRLFAEESLLYRSINDTNDKTRQADLNTLQKLDEYDKIGIVPQKV